MRRRKGKKYSEQKQNHSCLSPNPFSLSSPLPSSSFSPIWIDRSIGRDGEDVAAGGSEREGGGDGGPVPGAVSRVRDGPVGVAEGAAVPGEGLPGGPLRPGLRRQRQPGQLRLRPVLLPRPLRRRPARCPRRPPHRTLRLRRPLHLRHDRLPRLHPPPRALHQARPPRRLPRFLNDKDYHGGFERNEIEKVFSAMESNYEAWVSGYAPLAVGADVPVAVREFSRTLFNMRPDISLFVCQTVFFSDFRPILGLVKVPCCIIQGIKDMSVPLSVANYMKAHLGGKATVEILQAEGHLPHLSAPQMLVPVLRRALAR